MPTFANNERKFSGTKPSRFDAEQVRQLFPQETMELYAPAFSQNGFMTFCEALSQSQLKQLSIQKLFLSEAEWITFVDALPNKSLEVLDISFCNIPALLITRILGTVPSLKVLKTYLSRGGNTEDLEKAILAHAQLEEFRGEPLSNNNMRKHLAINKEFSTVKALLVKLKSLADRKRLAYSFFINTKEEISKHLMTILESNLSIERYNDLLQEVYFTFGDYFNQFHDTAEAEKYLSRAVGYFKATPFTDKARVVLANLYYAKGIDPNMDVLERLAYLRKSEALNEPTLVEYTQRTIVSTCSEALAVCDRTALLLSQEKDANEKKLLASPTKFKDTAKRFPEPPSDPKKLLTVHLPSSPKL